MSAITARAATARMPIGPRRKRARSWIANPWGKPRFLAVYTWLFLAWSIVPVLIAVQFSFNSGRSRSTWQGFSLRWYVRDPYGSILHDAIYRAALLQSLKLAVLTMLIAAPLGTALALGLLRWRGRGSKPASALMLFPLATPEIVMGTALFLVFVHLFRFVHLGTPAQLIGHVTFTTSFVVIVVRGRLLSIGRQYEEAAQDLGASPTESLRRVLLPLLYPALFASLMLVFALSIDDFVISSFLVGDASTQTIPVLIYSTARGAPTPALNALASVMLFTSLLAIGLGLLVARLLRSNAGEKGSAVENLARLEIS